MFRLVELVNQSKEKDCEAARSWDVHWRDGRCVVLEQYLSYRQVWRWSVLSRAVSTWGSVEVPLWSGDVLSLLQVAGYNADTARQLH